MEDVKGVIDALTATMNAKIKSEKAKAGKKRMKIVECLSNVTLV